MVGTILIYIPIKSILSTNMLDLNTEIEYTTYSGVLFMEQS